MRKYFNFIAIQVLIILGVMFYFRNHTNEHNERILALQLEAQTFTKTINSLNQKVVNQEAIIVNSDRALKSYLDSITDLNLRLKRVQSFARTKSTISITDTFIHYTIDTINSVDTLYLKCAQHNDPWLNLSICNLDSGLLIHEISFRDTGMVVFTSSGIFRRKYEANYINSNPYKSVNQFNTVIVDRNKNNRLYMGAGLFAAGLFLGTLAF